MALSSSQANQYTLQAIQQSLEQDVINEIRNAEQQIRSTISNQQVFKTSFFASIIGNPSGNPNVVTLSDRQQQFFDHFVNQGYFVNVDTENGNWLLDWSQVGGVPATVHLYSVRTTVSPGAVSAATISAIDNFFGTLIPVAISNTVLADTDPTSGGDIPETDFGASGSVFYEYLSVVQQQDSADHSLGLKTALRASGLGYVDDTRVTGVGGAANTTANSNTVDISNGPTTVTITVGGTGTATDLVNAINNNSTLQAISIIGDIDGADILIKNTLGGTLIVTNNVGDVLGDIFGLASPQAGVITDNTEVYKFI